MNRFSKKLFIETLLARLLLILFCTVGLMAYNTLVRENYPDLEIPQALITTEWPGASPEQVEKEVTKYLEDEIRGLKGLKSFSSGSYNSYSMVAVEFEADVAQSEAMQRLRSKVDKAESEFPTGVGIEKPDIEEMSVSDMPVITWVLHGNVDDLILTDTAKQLERQLEQIPGVKKVNLGGLREKSLHIRLKPDRLRALGISPQQVRNRLTTANRDMSWGEFEGNENTLNLYMSGRFNDIAELKQLPIVRLDQNRSVRLEELADVSLRLDREETRTSFSLKGSEYTSGITLDVLKQPSGDTLAVIARTEVLIADILQSRTWPSALDITRVSDDAELIETAFNDTSSSMIQAVIIVFLVLMFLLSWREAIVAGIAIPVTLLAALGLLIPLGYSFNSMVMIGMVLALGLLVDMFILVMEGMHDGLYVRKESFKDAAIRTVKTYAVPAIAGQTTTIMAMIPMMMVGGIDGKFIRILPITITLCLIMSLIIAFLICIPMSRYMLKAKQEENQSLLIDRLSSKAGQDLSRWLLAVPLKTKKHSGLWVAGATVMFIFSIVIAGMLPSQMYPEADDRKIGVSIELPPDATLDQAQRVADKAGGFLRQQPWIEKSIAYVGNKSPVTTASLKEALLPAKSFSNVGFTVILTHKEEREKLSFEYLEELRSGLEQMLHDEPGLRLMLTHVGGDPEGADPVQIVLTGPDYDILADISRQVQQRLLREPGATSVRDNLGAPVQEIRFRLNEENLSFHGLDEATVAEQVRIAMAEDEIGYFKVAGLEDDPKLRLGYDWPSRAGVIGSPQHISEVSLLHIIGSNGQTIPISDLTEFEINPVPQVFVHSEGVRAVTVKARTEGRTASDIMLGALPDLEKMRAEWPDGYNFRLEGELTKSAESYGDMGKAFIIAMLLIFILLTLLYNSLTQPIIVLMIVPLCITGTFLGYFLSGIPMSFSGLIGVVSLAGIAVNNAIVLVDTANRHRDEGMSLREAAAQAVASRLRPIVSTSLTTILGLIPLALSDPQWYPLCMAIVFGLITSVFMALFIIPCLYVLLSKEKEHVTENEMALT